MHDRQAKDPLGRGQRFNYTGTTAPSTLTVSAPPEGSRAAISETSGPGSHVLYQDVALEAGATHTLSFTTSYSDNSGGLATPSPETLDYTVSPNQQFRIDIMDPAAVPESVAAADVLAAVFQTQTGDPASLAPTPMTVDLTPFAGQTVRIRFAEVDNLGVLNAGVDAVSIASQGVTTVTNQASPAVNVGGVVSDTATLASPFTPTGTVTFSLYGPDDATCARPAVFSSAQTVPANGVVTSAAFTTAAPGTYRWVASYSGDATSAAVTSACNAPNSTVVVSAVAVPVGQPAAPVVAQPRFTG